MVHDSFSLSEPVVRAFEDENNVKLEFIKAGDSGAALNRAILTKSSPQADVLYGVDNGFLSRAIREGVFESYASPLLSDISDEFKMDPENGALPVDFGDVCINYDRAYFAERDLPIPDSLEDLTDPLYKGLLVVQNPATSSPGLAFLLTTISAYGEEGYLDYWKKLISNDVLIANDWEAAYYTHFSASSGKGAQPMVVSYSSSPAAEMIFAETPLSEAPTASILSDGMCYRQVEFVGILKGTPNRELAEKFVDALLSKSMQEDIPMQMFVYPVNPEANIPEEFQQYAQTAENPVVFDPQKLDSNREKYLQDWESAIQP
jgi:thiamine transport system substrate-binding protein